MPFPKVIPGHVIRYAYLWRSEYEAGLEEGRKDRSCAVVLTVLDHDGRDVVFVLPITHTPPHDPDDAVELPAETKRRLGLDEARSWIVVTEFNRFVWPGPDLRPLRRSDTESVVYGLLSRTLFNVLRRKFVERARAGKAVVVPRTE